MIKPLATIAEIDNGYLVSTVEDNNLVTIDRRTNQPVDDTKQKGTTNKFCSDYEDVCNALKSVLGPK